MKNIDEVLSHAPSQEYTVYDRITGQPLMTTVMSKKDVQQFDGIVFEGIFDLDLSHLDTSTGDLIISEPTIKMVDDLDIKHFASKKILAKYPLWKQLNMIRASEAEQIKMYDAIDKIREASNRLEKMKPIPDDYTDEKWWKE